MTGGCITAITITSHGNCYVMQQAAGMPRSRTAAVKVTGYQDDLHTDNMGWEKLRMPSLTRPDINTVSMRHKFARGRRGEKLQTATRPVSRGFLAQMERYLLARFL